ncbi:sulfurtransferase [Roseateles chitosanitabidus]|uniref:sulfurtransferase n=1 Tax=Roseateles chitosanitabidus TaxID=65048 RepID=UPI000A0138D2|nr:sulfurtransferase [Roseateles chitosanitabidus]MBO9686242.1 sulfurtransferase [Roseateles chitosanitabidus]
MSSSVRPSEPPESTASAADPADAAASVLNISCYLFVGIDDPHALRERLHEHASALGLKGTVLIAEEGINLFLAGPAAAVNAWVGALRADARFAALAPKESWSEATPFRKLLVKVKPEIIRMNHPTIRPDQAPRAPALPAATLKRWLDQGHDDDGRPVVTLDTRNAFEVDVGAFDHAIDWRITKFSEFPDAVRAHREELAGKTVVSYCTGGIRCEKAALFLDQQDLGATVYQLEGGILKYFEEVGGAHYHGNCFVFDERRALDPALAPSPIVEPHEAAAAAALAAAGETPAEAPAPARPTTPA